MENKFEYLKIDGRGQLPAPWSDYPVLTEYETVTVYRNGRDYLDALVGQQDGWWVAGVHMQVNSSGAGFNPGRKWGQFSTRENALLWALGWMLCHKKMRGAARQAVLDQIDNIRQLKLF
ncbi:hypothetical protein PO249_01525 [Bacteroides ovatus]|nr:hypothetical protein [Bacteroides ovatus]MDC2616094.1 hypothetical protein [Bacteroides ovatus]